MKKLLFSSIYILLVSTLIMNSSCKKEFIKPTDLCDCFTFTKMTFADIMQGDTRYRTIENEHFYILIQSYLENKEKRTRLTELIGSKADRNYEYIHSLLKTNKRSEDDTVVIYVPNYDHANFNRNPIFAIADILDDSLSGGEDRIWGAYIDEEDYDEIKYIILDEDHARNTSRPVFIFDTRFIVPLIVLPEVGEPLDGGQAQAAATGDKYFISYVQSFIDLDNDNTMEISRGYKVWYNYYYTHVDKTINFLSIHDNQINNQVLCWLNIPYNINPVISQFPLGGDHYLSQIIYDYDWPGSTKYYWLYPPMPYNNWQNGFTYFGARMTNSSSTLIAWGNIRISNIPNGWYLPAHNCPAGWYGIYHYN